MRRFTHTFPQRISAFLLCLALLVGLLPSAAFAAGTDTGKAIQLVDSGTAANIDGYDSTNGYDYIYYGTWNGSVIKWRVLDDQTNTGENGLFLLSEELLGTGNYGGVYFQQSYHYDSSSGSYHKGSAPANGDHTDCLIANAWQGSDAQTWCATFYSSNFSTGEQGAVIATTKSDEAFISSTYSYQFAASEIILNGDKVFFLSAQEAENSEYGFTNDAARIANYGGSVGVWWLRSPFATRSAGVVDFDGYVNLYYVGNVWAARPAFNLDLTSVLFTSAAVGGKTDSAVDSSLTTVADYAGNEWKLTLLDSSRKFAVTEDTAAGKPGGTITLDYTGATVYNADTAPNEYISVIIADNNGAQYYGRVAQPTEASGTVSIKIPDTLADGTYTLHVFSEQYNGGENDDTKLTDYASAFEAVTLTVDTTAFATGIMLGTGNISGYDSTNGYDYIYYGEWDNSPIKWRVLDDQTNTGADGLFLLSDVLLGTGTYGGVYFDSTSPYGNTWQGSDAQTWCQDFYSDNFSAGEQGAVIATTKSDEAFISSTYSYQFAASENILNGDKVFFLSAEEAENSAYGFTDDNARIANYGNSAGVWWLRSPVADITDAAGLVYYSGNVDDYGVVYDWAARPAFNLDLNSVLFISAAEGGKISAAASGGNQGGVGADAIFEIGDYAGNEWKLTLLDNSRNFAVTEKTASGKPADTITLHYSGATTGTNEYISVIIADNSGAQYYGRVAQPTEASGQIQIKIPASLADGTYTLNVFSEQYNGGANDDTKLTDYASAFEAVTLTVSNDTTAPTLSNGSATRDSDTTATVKFTSDEAGTCYYIAQDTEITLTKEQIAAQGTQKACEVGENEIKLDNISASAQYVAVVVKDAVNNVSNVLTIPIPAYTYTLTVNLNGGSGSTTGGQYPAGTAVPIDAGRRSNYRFTGWTTSNGGSFTDASSASTTFTMPAADTTITANWQYDPPYIPPSKPNWTSVARKLANAQPGDTVTVKMNGETEVPGEVWETIAGRDVTVVLDMGGNVSWTVDGNDVPTATHFADMDFGVDRNTTGIDADVINTVTGEVSSVQITLAHDGEFGFTLTLTAPLGKENAGYWANLYHYDENAKTLNYETSAQVASDGTASLRMTHASQYAIVIDDKSHDLPFTDLGEGQWYESAVRYAYTHDIMEGMSATTFQPNGTLSRAMAVQIFYNLEGQPDLSGENLGYPYEDVDAQAWYGDAVYWARLTGVATGYGDGTFQPTDSITRQEFAQMLYNYAKYKGYDLTAEGDLSQFPDSNTVADWAEAAMAWANGNELINGHDDGTIDAAGIGTRAQAASILMRFDQNLVEK